MFSSYMICSNSTQNRIRQASEPEYYLNVYGDDEFKKNGALGKEHISHCIESIRQSLMCASDISVIVWRWKSIAGKAQAHNGVIHTCRNFDKVKDWGMEAPTNKWSSTTRYILKMV
jgi:hypothetical protein